MESKLTSFKVLRRKRIWLEEKLAMVGKEWRSVITGKLKLVHRMREIWVKRRLLWVLEMRNGKRVKWKWYGVFSVHLSFFFFFTPSRISQFQHYTAGRRCQMILCDSVKSLDRMHETLGFAHFEGDARCIQQYYWCAQYLIWKVKNIHGFNLKDFGAPIHHSCFSYTKLNLHLRRRYSSSLRLCRHVIFIGLWSFFSSIGCRHWGSALNGLFHRRGKLLFAVNGCHFYSWFCLSYGCSWFALEVENRFMHSDQVGIRFVHTNLVDLYEV